MTTLDRVCYCDDTVVLRDFPHTPLSRDSFRVYGFDPEKNLLSLYECIFLFRELEVFITKTDILRQLFDHHLAVRKTRAYNRVSQKMMLSQLH